MKIIISPAKKMVTDSDTMAAADLPVFLERAKQILAWLRKLSDAELQRLWGCNEKLVRLNQERVRSMDLESGLTPALLSYEGIQYQYMAPRVFSQDQWNYVQEHLRILSGFYGILKPLDAVTPYRLEMQAKGAPEGFRNLYEFWGSALWEQLLFAEEEKEQLILNLASKEYSKCIQAHVDKNIRFVTCVFGEYQNGKVVQKGTMAKMARGEMVRFLAEKGVDRLEGVKAFDRLDYRYAPELSAADELVFLREQA